MKVAGILLAAGASSRMGDRDKLTEIVRGRALLEDRARMMLVSKVDPVMVVLAPERPARIACLDGLDVDFVFNPDAQTGMASSIQEGLSAVPDECIGAVILPADMPNVTSAHIDALVETLKEDPATLWRSIGREAEMTAPNAIPRAYFGLFKSLSGDQGGRAVMQFLGDKVAGLPLDGDDPTLDLDTPEAWEKWRRLNDSAT